MQDHTADLARGLVAAGHQVEVITGMHPRRLREEQVDGVRRHRVEAAPGDFTCREWREQSTKRSSPSMPRGRSTSSTARARAPSSW